MLKRRRGKFNPTVVHSGRDMQLWYRLPVVAAAKTTASCTTVAAAGLNRSLTTAQPSSNIPPVLKKTTSLQLPNSKRESTMLSSSSSYSVAVSVPVSPPPIKATPELGLVYLLFVLSTAFSALISLSVISIPTMNAFRRLEASANQLSNIVSQEVPGTLFSLKLSGLEIQELTQQLASLREKISAGRYAEKKRKHQYQESKKPKLYLEGAKQVSNQNLYFNVQYAK